jgi:hypothetical protein
MMRAAKPFKQTGALPRLLGLLAVWAVLLAAGLGPVQAAAPTDGYYTFSRQDLRKCPWPVCGGIYVRQVNTQATRCADGVLRSDCYVAAVDTRNLGLSAVEAARFGDAFNAGRGLALGQLRMTRRILNGNPFAVPMLAASEAWLAQAPTPQNYGAFYAAANNGIVCVASPCDTLALSKLNSKKAGQAVAGLQLDQITLPASAKTEIQARLNQAGLLAAGVLVPVKGEVGSDVALSARQIYLPAKGSNPQPPFACDNSQADCPTGRFCDTPAGACGNSKAVGQCAAKPQICYMLYMPVCGCDGKTYSNDCVRQSAGVSLAHNGACALPD